MRVMLSELFQSSVKDWLKPVQAIILILIALIVVPSFAEDLETLSKETEETEIQLTALRDEIKAKKDEVSKVEKDLAALDRKVKLQKEELVGLKEKEKQVSDEITKKESDLKIEKTRVKEIFKGIILKANTNLRVLVSSPKIGAAEMGTYLRGISRYQAKVLSTFSSKLSDLESQKADLLLMRDEKEIVLKDQERNLSKIKELRSNRTLELKNLEKQGAEVRALLLKLKQRSLRVQTALKGIGSSVTVKDSLRGLVKGKASKPIEGKIVKEFKSKKAYQFVKGTAASQGIELRGKAGDDVNSIAKGKVSFAGPLPGYGQVVILDHGARNYSLYGNLGTIAVRKGDLVQGKIGTLAESGGLYFEIRVQKSPVDPAQFIDD